MATSQATLGAISDDATWRAYVQFVHDLLDSAGFVQTVDTGQTDISSATRPSAGVGNAVDYEIWRFDDPLQDSHPIFFRVLYGCGSGTNYFGMWITIGKGSNGSGVITDEILSIQPCGQGQASAANTVSVGSGKDGAWVNLFLSAYLSTTEAYSNTWCGFSLERSKNAAGEDTGDGLLVYLFSYGTSQANTYCRYSDGTYWIDRQGGALTPYSQTSGAGPDAKTAVYPNYAFSAGRTEFPGKNLAACFGANFANLTNFDIRLYGEDVPMRAFNNATSATVQLVSRSHSNYNISPPHRILMRWE